MFHKNHNIFVTITRNKNESSRTTNSQRLHSSIEETVSVMKHAATSHCATTPTRHRRASTEATDAGATRSRLLALGAIPTCDALEAGDAMAVSEALEAVRLRPPVMPSSRPSDTGRKEIGERGEKGDGRRKRCGCGDRGEYKVGGLVEI
jgi:hypothetical protein